VRHKCDNKTMGRNTSHRKAMVKNMVNSLIKHGRIETTVLRAKVTSKYAEKMLTLGKKGDLHARRLAFAFLRDDEALKKLFSEIAPRFTKQKGGYTRILKTGHRLGDAASMAILEWVDYELPAPKES
jgi:large subunit ribosomal protein L17